MYKISDIRNAKQANPEGSVIVFELKHKKFSWIPCSLNIQDPEELKDIRDLILKVQIEDYKEPLIAEDIKKKLETLTVTTSTGRVFDATSQARQDLADAIIASSTANQTQTVWRLADNSEEVVTLEELREAHLLAILAYAKTKKIGI